MRRNYANFFELKDAVITNITGLEINNDTVVITSDKGTFHLTHLQDCCESVSINKVFGTVEGVLNSKVILAEEDNGANDPEWYTGRYYDSHTWTSYKIKCENGNTLSFWYLGESNGYYGEGVTVTKL